MKVHGFGIDFSTRNRVIQSMDEEVVSSKILASFPHETFAPTTKLSVDGQYYREDITRIPTMDLNNFHELGWTFIVGDTDPLKDQIIETMKPLAIHRGMKHPNEPLIFDCEDNFFEWKDWIITNCWSFVNDEHPVYVLIIGDCKQIPFRFQSNLDSLSFVGRIHFDSIIDLKNYVDKVLRIEKASNPIVDREVIMFAPDWGLNDPTFFSKTFMVEPLSYLIKDKLNFSTKDLFEEDATKKNLVNSLTNNTPALVYSASHGIIAKKEELAEQKKYNGAICCQNMRDHSIPKLDCIYSANDVPKNEPYLEGSVFFEFSCFGYGTPKRSDFDYWGIGDDSLNAEEDIISALPKKLLAHPRGPIGFFGHVDTAWLHGFADPEKPYIRKRWSPRIAPFRKAVEEILSAQTLGLVLSAMNKNAAQSSDIIDTLYKASKTNPTIMTAKNKSRLIDHWITRTDARNYMLFGDPATHVRIPKVYD